MPAATRNTAVSSPRSTTLATRRRSEIRAIAISSSLSVRIMLSGSHEVRRQCRSLRDLQEGERQA